MANNEEDLDLVPSERLISDGELIVLNFRRAISDFTPFVVLCFYQRVMQLIVLFSHRGYLLDFK